MKWILLIYMFNNQTPNEMIFVGSYETKQECVIEASQWTKDKSPAQWACLQGDGLRVIEEVRDDG